VIISPPIEARHVEIDGEAHPYNDAFYVWADPATTCGLPATVAPIGHSLTGLPIGVQIIRPYLEDRTTIAFAEIDCNRHLGGLFGVGGCSRRPDLIFGKDG
jgi:amidase